MRVKGMLRGKEIILENDLGIEGEVEGAAMHLLLITGLLASSRPTSITAT
jgi:hypothetical protein